MATASKAEPVPLRGKMEVEPSLPPLAGKIMMSPTESIGIVGWTPVHGGETSSHYRSLVGHGYDRKKLSSLSREEVDAVAALDEKERSGKPLTREERSLLDSVK
jgi:hypothetical protein